MTQTDAKPRVIVDTNLFVSGTIIKRGNPHALLSAWRSEAFDLLLSSEQLHELTDVMTRPKLVDRYHLTDRELAELFAHLATMPRVDLRNALPVTVRDAKDEHLLAAALAGHAQYLVTGDDDLLELRDDARLNDLKIVTAVEFLAILARRHVHAEDEPR